MIQSWKRCFLRTQRELCTKYSNYVPYSFKGRESHTRRYGGQSLLSWTVSVLFLLGGKEGLFVPYQGLILQEYVGDERPGKAKFRHLSLDCDMKSSFDSCYINNNYLTS